MLRNTATARSATLHLDKTDRIGAAIRASMRVAGATGFAEYAFLTIGLTAMAALVTWPHAQFFTSHVVSNIDPLFSMWRLAWFSHAIRNGVGVFDANIFHAEPQTFLLSDATLVQGALALMPLGAGLPLPAVYNALLLLGIVSSGIAIYWLATSLGVDRPAALFGAVVFSFAPYRIEHIMHLELQWIAPAVVAFASLFRVLYRPAWRNGLALGVSVALQFLASVYYAVFLLPLLVVLAAASAATVPDRHRTLRVGLLSVVVCAVLTLPIARLYLRQGTQVGARPLTDITMYSATVSSYFAAPETNVVYGGTAERWGAGEKRLFPGALAVVLAVVGVFSARRRLAIAALIVVVVSVDLSLGVHGLLYPLLLDWVPVFHGLRAPARYGVYALAGVAILAALGCERLASRAHGWKMSATVVAAIAIACLEYRSPQRHLSRADMDPPVYRLLRQLPSEGAVLELPLPARSGEAGLDVDYTFWSTRHWRKLVNGYSGYYPPSYDKTLARLRSLPDDDSIALLRERGVRYIVLHLEYFKSNDGADLLTRLLARSELRSVGQYRDWLDAAAVFEVLP